MSEYASRGRGHESSYAPRTSAYVETYTPRQRTAAEQAHEAICNAEREVGVVAWAIDAVRTAHASNDPARWEQARAALDRQLATADVALDRARARAADASLESTGQLARTDRELAERRATAVELRVPPRGWNPVHREAELLAVLTAAIDGAAHAGFACKEAEIKAELARLSPAESRVVAERIGKNHPGDPIAAELARMVPARRARIVDFLAGARRRVALQARHTSSVPRSFTRSTHVGWGPSIPSCGASCR